MSEIAPLATGGRRRIDRVLAPGYLDGLAGRDLEEVRVAKREAEQEEADLSYIRRLLQGRLDILRAEASRRAGGGADSTDDFVERLTRTLSDGESTRSGTHGTRGASRFVHVEPSRVGEHRRRVEQLVADVGFSDLGAQSDDDLRGAIERLTGFEDSVSHERREVQHVVDACVHEIGRRYKEGGASIEDLLTGR